MPKTISELIMEFFMKHPNQEFKHGPVVDWVTEQWLKDHDKSPRDPWRATIFEFHPHSADEEDTARHRVGNGVEGAFEHFHLPYLLT